MARNIVNTETSVNMDELVTQYCENKAELDKYKKLCDTDNASIKSIMADNGLDSYTAGKYTVKRVVANRESINEDRLLTILKKHNLNALIKTVEVVDMAAFEDYIYNQESHPINDELLGDLQSCRESSQTIQLRVSTKKGD